LIAGDEPAPIVLKRTGQGPEATYSIETSDLPSIVGPVSANAGGIYGGCMLQPDQLRWNSFNAGEFLFPESRWSLLPLLLCGGALGWFAFRFARKIDVPT
jgi:hypothetical protein